VHAPAVLTHTQREFTPPCRDVHREEKICALGSEVVNTWFKGIAMGPEAARDALQADIDTAVAYRSHQVLRHHKGQVRCLSLFCVLNGCWLVQL
jgi:hypothetical protein